MESVRRKGASGAEEEEDRAHKVSLQTRARLPLPQEAKTPRHARHAVRRPGRRKKVGERAGCLALRACVSLSLVDTPRPLPLRRRLASSALSGGAHGFPKVGTRPSSSTPPPCAGHGAHGRPGHARLSLALAYPTLHSAAKVAGGWRPFSSKAGSNLSLSESESQVILNPENSRRSRREKSSIHRSC